jgi:RNA polymerase sigma-B factor
VSEQRPPSGALLTRAGDEQLAVSAQAGDDAARETLIMRHRRLVWRVARAFRSAGFPLEDLHQAGTIGLIVAVDRFDPERGVRFATYARALIQGELQHLLRDHGWAVRVPRSLQELGRAAVDEEVRLTQAGGAPASTADISASLNEDGALVAEALQAWTAYRAVRWFDEADGADSDDPAIRDALSVDDPGFEHAEDRLAIAAALPRLPVRQRRIIALRFWRGMKQKHIASELGMSQMHVSRLLAAALQNLAEAMAR